MFSFLVMSTYSQEENLILHGRVEEGTVRAIVKKNARDQYLALEDVTVTVLEGDILVKRAQTDSSGDYRLTLFPNKEYTVTFSKKGHLDKVFVIDGTKYKGKKDRAHMMECDVALFQDLGNEKLRQYVQIPSAKCRYYKNRKEFRWDMMYAESQQHHFLKLLEEATIASLQEK